MYFTSDLFTVRVRAKNGTVAVGEARTLWHGLGDVAVRVTVDVRPRSETPWAS